MSFCCCSLDSETRAALNKINILDGIRDLIEVIVLYTSAHGIQQPFQASDDEPFDNELRFDGQLIITWDAFRSELDTDNQRIYAWSLERSTMNGYTRCIIEKDVTPYHRIKREDCSSTKDVSTAYRISSKDWLLNVQIKAFSVESDTHIGFQRRHIIGLEPRKDSEKIITLLYRYGSETVKFKLCRSALSSPYLPSVVPPTDGEKQYIEHIRNKKMTS